MDEDSIALRYTNNPNGSIGDIAGITNSNGNVLGLMRHPERACDRLTGGIAGNTILKALLIILKAIYSLNTVRNFYSLLNKRLMKLIQNF